MNHSHPIYQKRSSVSSPPTSNCNDDQVNIACNDNQRINTILQACFVNKSSTKPQAELELEYAKKHLNHPIPSIEHGLNSSI
jgi:hypothetical protein